MSSNTISVLNGSMSRTHEVRGNARVSEIGAPPSANQDPPEGKVLPPAAEEADKQPQRLQEVVSELNGYVQNIRRNLEFSVDDESGRIVIKVIDSESKEIIRQIPPEEAVQLAKALEGSRDGTILNAKA